MRNLSFLFLLLFACILQAQENDPIEEIYQPI
jgi:hypothetical protein